MQRMPLAEMLRPETLDDVIGQEHLLASGKSLRVAAQSDILHSMVLWGPPGSGKTTIARIISHSPNVLPLTLSAVHSGVKEIRDAASQGKKANAEGQTAVLFVDEVHRFNKSQQDAFLPHVENGDLVLIGATTENPSFELTSALMSRVRVYVLKPLQKNDLKAIIQRCLNCANKLLPDRFELSEDAMDIFTIAAQGDARRLLNFVELARGFFEGRQIDIVSAELAAEIVGQPLARFDKRGDVFYELISALHKAVRGSDPDASLYWLARMLVGGCDPLYIARRVVRIASEDIGNADPNALNVAINSWETYQKLGSPEGELAIAQAVVYLACCPKSNAVYKAFGYACKDAQEYGELDVPLHLRNAPTRFMKNLEYGKNYRYAHDEPDAVAKDETYFPEGMKQTNYYQPVDRGVEKRIKAYMETIRKK